MNLFIKIIIILLRVIYRTHNYNPNNDGLTEYLIIIIIASYKYIYTLTTKARQITSKSFIKNIHYFFNMCIICPPREEKYFTVCSVSVTSSQKKVTYLT